MCYRDRSLCWIALLGIVVFLFLTGDLFSYSEAQLNTLLKENEREKRLIQYKDNRATLKLKLEVLDVINKNRSRHGVKPVELDIFTCRVASMTASEAARGQYHGHWNMRGEKPYHRYAFAGGVHHVSENASSVWGSIPEKKYQSVLRYCIESHMRMYNETPPNDGHRKNILNRWHTHVGLGFSMIGGQFRYYEQFVDKYLEFDPFKDDVKAGDEVRISGKVSVPNYGVFFLTVYYEPFPRPMTAAELRSKGSYPDFTGTRIVSKAFWDIQYDDSTKRFDLSFNTSRKGLYYVHIYIKRGHTGKESPGRVTTYGLTPVSGIVIKAH
jgi:uncharacterized protein YkwD